ncbi:MAG TPA: LLM class flavin-dependent oxidoreductase [Gaiellaceae bacterium]|jgi:probable F420-dependent oxidoreductase|nr:LLM class flavin-dependent oxidoreductase [Gaiellaceae bacterium]
MRIGVQLPEVEREVRWPELRRLAVAAEEAGFESVWVGDHLLYRGDGRPERGPWDCWTTLAGLATATERVRLGPLVACTAFREPGLLARTAAAVDELSGGRLVVALGSGWNQVEFDAFGLPFDRRVARFAEAFEIVRRLLAGERVTFHGDFHRVDDAVLLPPPARRPPLMVGANGPRMLELTLPHVDAWNTWFTHYGNRADGFARLNAEVDQACERAGRDPREVARSACLLVRVGGGAGERPDDPEAPHLDAAGLRAELDGLAQAGAGEAILVLDPIDEASIRELGALVFS